VTVVAGRVLGASGTPLADARVAFAEAPVPVPDIAAVTGPDGGFALSAPAHGRYVVLAAADGHVPAQVAVDVRDERVEVEIELTEEAA
jgi:hypothetical protein